MYARPVVPYAIEVDCFMLAGVVGANVQMNCTMIVVSVVVVIIVLIIALSIVSRLTKFGAGVSAVVAAAVIKARSGRFRGDGSVYRLPQQSPALQTLGALILWVGWCECCCTVH